MMLEDDVAPVEHEPRVNRTDGGHVGLIGSPMRWLLFSAHCTSFTLFTFPFWF
jgi:hypothetical protein